MAYKYSMNALTNPSMESLSKGSLWHRWDLHVHSPASALENNFAGWDEYIDALEKGPEDVIAVAITDYCSIEGYKRVSEYKAKGRLKRFALVLPNIEFRIEPKTKAGSAINIHLLISPRAPNHLEVIEQNLAKLTFEYKGNLYACVPKELTALGKAFDGSQSNDEAAYRQGINLFKPSFDSFRGWYENSKWLKENSLVVLANGEDGASGLSKDSGFAAVREELYRFANLVFSGKPADRKYFLGLGTDSVETVKSKCGNLKACVHGSDAHSEGKLFQPDNDRYCWIKAAPTFEGLRQILFEPDDRVYIGPTPPSAIDESKVISAIEFSKGEQWFAESRIDLNPGLTAIIGEKGSGKTALADLLAYAAGAYSEDKRSSSFIKKARPFLSGLKLRLIWADGHPTSASLDKLVADAEPAVRYLSQDFVEELCSGDTSGRALISEIEQVVFSSIPDGERLDASSFDDLRRQKTELITSRRDDIRSQISKLNSEIAQLEDVIAERDSKEKAKVKAKEQLGAIELQIPKLQGSVDPAIAARLSKERDNLSTAQQELSGITKALARIRTSRSSIDEYRKALTEHFDSIADVLADIGLDAAEIEPFRLRLPANVEGPIDRKEIDLQRRMLELKGNTKGDKPSRGRIAQIESAIAELEKNLAANTKERERLIALETEKSRLTKDIGRIEKEIVAIDTTLKRTLEKKRDARWGQYLDSFRLLEEERAILEELFEPLRHVIEADSTGAKQGFEFSVVPNVDVGAWLEFGRPLFDGRTLKIFNDNAFIAKLDALLGSPWRQGCADEIRKGLEAVIKEVGEGPSMNKGLVKHANRPQAYDWIFSTGNVHLEYSLKYKGTDLALLSPGARGIVLLVLYLEMDRRDRRPLIVDQPEGNLDSASIYESLVPFLRRAKKERQVILITHNPNLVVATDADLVVVATATKGPGALHPRISYRTGGLEDSYGSDSIREKVCTLLEGGREAFRTRENRYAFEDAK